MKKILIAGFLFINIFRLTAQSDYRAGWVLKNSNDTIYGLIDYRGNKANAKKCSFKAGKDSPVQTFTPEEIQGYRFTNSKYYTSKSVNTGDETKQLFLEFLINGIVDIYYYRDNQGEHYFIDNGTGNLYELKKTEKEIVQNNTRYMMESKEYIGLLKAIFKESSTVSKKVENINLNHKSLINIAEDYHNEVCTDGECIIYEKKLPKIKSTFGFVLGLNGLYITESGEFAEEFYYLKNNQFGFKFFPSIGLFYKVNMPYINERLFFQYEGAYSRVNMKTTNSYIEPTYDMNLINDINYTQNTFSNLAIIKYEFPKGKIRPTFEIGGFFNYFFKTQYSRDLEIQFSWGETYLTSHSNDNPFDSYDFGINLGAGLTSNFLNKKEFSVDFRYQRGLGLFKNLHTNTFSVNLAFQIGR